MDNYMRLSMSVHVTVHICCLYSKAMFHGLCTQRFCYCQMREVPNVVARGKEGLMRAGLLGEPAAPDFGQAPLALGPHGHWAFAPTLWA